MNLSELQEWARNGWLRALAASADDVANLLAVVDRDLSDARQRSISDDARFSLAYSAALQSAAAARLGTSAAPLNSSSEYRKCLTPRP